MRLWPLVAGLVLHIITFGNIFVNIRSHFVNIFKSFANCKSGATDEGLWPLVAGLVQSSLTDEISTGGWREGGKECFRMFFFPKH